MMQLHEFAKAIPEMTEDEYKELKADIKANGQKVPIVIFRNELLDGRHRARACEELKIKPKVAEFKGSDLEAAKLVSSLNLKRRHLTVGQRARIAVGTVGKAIADQAKENLKTNTDGSANRKVAFLRSEEGKNQDKPGLRTQAAIKAANKAAIDTAKEVSKITGVSARAIEKAQTVQRYSAPEELEDLDKGKTSLDATYKKAVGRKKEEKLKTSSPAEAKEYKEKVRQQQIKALNDKVIAYIDSIIESFDKNMPGEYLAKPYSKELIAAAKKAVKLLSKVK